MILTDKKLILERAKQALSDPIGHITDAKASHSEGNEHAYYSNGDYWWPNPDTKDGLPYIQRDGETNPHNFNAHRMILRKMRTDSVYLAAAWRLTKDAEYARHGVQILKEFFLDEETRMDPHLTYAQAIPGICAGRGIGIIDTLHLIDVVFVIDHLHQSGEMQEEVYKGLKAWFASYLGWMLTSANGIEEMNTDNNHAVCFFVQAAAFAMFTENQRITDFCKRHYKEVLLLQMAENGSFPRELLRTKPYNYSIFVMDNMVTLCQILSTPEDCLWTYEAPGGQSIKKGLDFIVPYVLDKSQWPYPADIMHFDAFPARASFLVFAGCTLGRRDLLDFYNSLPFEIADEEARRNIAVRLPWLWLK